MISFEEVVQVLTDVKLPDGNKMQFIQENNLDEYDIIDVANYVTIERDFYKRQCEKIEEDNQ